MSWAAGGDEAPLRSLRSLRCVALGGALWSTGGCAGQGAGGPTTRGPVPQDSVPVTVAAGVTRVALPAGLGPGLSGLDVDRHDRLWLVDEGATEVVVVRLDAGAADLAERWPLTGWPSGTEPEALAWTPAGVWLGAEAGRGRGHDQVLLATEADGVFAAAPLHDLPYAPLGLRPEPNRGVEALCVTEGAWLAVGEVVATERRQRRAPLWLGSTRSDVVQTGWLPLTTQTGKIAGLHCSPGQDGTLKVLAIERHYGVARLVRASLRDDGGAVIDSATDLVPALEAEAPGLPLPNLEGVAVLSDGRVVLVNDNQHGVVQGPSWLFVVDPGGG